MAVTLDSRPPEWGGVNRPLIYTFTTTGGPFTSYRIEAQVFRAIVNTSLGPKFSFSPINTVTEADVSEIIKAHLSHEWIKPVALNEVEADTSLEVYIKYQELYDGSATAVVNDIANPFHAVFGALQIPSTVGNNLTAYVPGDNTKKFLTIFDRPKLWRNYPATLSFIYPDALAELYVYSAQHNAADNLIGNEDYDRLTSANDDSVNRLDLINVILDIIAKTLKKKLVLWAVGPDVLSNPSFTTSLSPWVNVAGPDSDWVWETGGRAAVTFPADPDAVSDILRQDIAIDPAGWYWISVNVITDDLPQTLKVSVYHLNPPEEVLNVTYPASTPEATTFEYLVYINETFSRVEAIASGASVTAKTFHLANLRLNPFTPIDYTELLTLDVADACGNPVMLFWKNSLGGDAFWLFEHGQEAGYNYSGSKKAKRMTLFAEHLTLNQWEALNELNTLGEVYSNRITDSSIKSHTRDGAQVYIIDTSGNRTGVIVIPTNSVINTKDEVHSIEIEIEFPERI